MIMGVSERPSGPSASLSGSGALRSDLQGQAYPIHGDQVGVLA